MIIAIDPGNVTGYAIQAGSNVLTGHLGPEEHHRDLHVLLDKHFSSDMAIVCESFQRRTQHTELTSIEYIGVVKLFAQSFDVRLHMQTSSQGKTFVTNDKLLKLGMLSRPATRRPYKDINDAKRHLIKYLFDYDPNWKEFFLKTWK